MKKGLCALIKAIPLMVIGLIMTIKTVKRRRKLKKDEKEMMEKILKNQKRLYSVCDDQDRLVQETINTINELRERLNQPEYGEDPGTVDTSYDEVV